MARMALREEFEKVGNWFFRWRSYLPLVLTVLFFFALRTSASEDLDSNPTWEFLCLFISFGGLAIRMYAVGCAPRGTSGRNVAEQRAETLNQTGIYSVVRHPLYLGNFIMWLGIAFFIQSWWLILITVLVFWSYYEKIMFAEEEFLRRQFGDAYLNWANQTPAFLPTSFKNWKMPQLPFSWKNALRREYSGFFATVSIFGLMKLIKDGVIQEELVVDGTWLTIFLFSLAIYGTLMYLKKKTHYLDVEGR